VSCQKGTTYVSVSLSVCQLSSLPVSLFATLSVGLSDSMRICLPDCLAIFQLACKLVKGIFHKIFYSYYSIQSATFF